MAFIGVIKRKKRSIVVINTVWALDVFNGQWWLNKFISSLVVLFVALDETLRHRSLLVVAAGIGLGLGLSLTVFQQPAAIQAQLPAATTADREVISVTKIRLPGIKISTPVIWKDTSAGLEEKGVIQIAIEGDHPIASDVRQLTVGEKIEVIGSNNGRYSYRVVETRIEPRDSLISPYNQTTESLILHTPQQWWSTEEFVVVARPVQ